MTPEKEQEEFEVPILSSPFTDLTEEQSASITEFRSAFSDEENTEMNDYDCIRFLIARQWNLEKAIAMKQYDFKMRRNHQCHLLPSKPVDPVTDIICKLRRQGINYGCYGQDKQGHPVCYQFQGAFLNLPLYKYVSTEQFKSAWRWNREVFHQHQLRPSGKPQMLYVIDVGDSSFDGRNNAHFVKEVIKLNSAHTPEYSVKMIIVNAPKLLTSVCWAMIKPFVPEESLKKISFHDEESTPSALAEHIDKKYLPKKYGGDVDDAKCFTPKLDEVEIEKLLLELKRMREENAERGFAKSMHLAATQTETVEVQCEANALVKWWFVVEAYNVMFSVRWKPHDQEEWIEIREPAKKGDEVIDGTRSPVYSEYMVDCAGTMEFVFSNEHSRWRGKTISYDIHTQGEMIRPPSL